MTRENAESSLYRPCPVCKQPRLLVKLHGDDGGPEMCMPCGWDVHAVRRRKRLEHQRMFGMLSGGLRGGDHAGDDELSRELLDDAVALCHPDRHPAERAEQCHRVTAELLALRPFVRSKPPERNRKPGDGSADIATATDPQPSPDDGSATSRTRTDAQPSTGWPAGHSCAGTLPPAYYCDPCRARHDADRREQLDRDNASRRDLRARRRRARPAAVCAVCDTTFTGCRADARYCSATCRQRAYRSRKDTA